MPASVSTKMTAHSLVLVGVLLMILFTEKCCGRTGNCPYQYCPHIATYLCGSGGLVNLPCVVYNATGPIQVRWYHSQNGNPAVAEELNITTGGRYTVEEFEQSSSNSRYENCTGGDQLYRNTLNFNYSEADSGSYWCRIVIGGGILLELSEPWTVDSITSGLPICGTGPSQTDPKCAAGQITTTPTLLSTTLLAQSSIEITSEPSVIGLVTPSPVQTPISTTASGGGTLCFVYGLAAGLGPLTMIILLVATVSVLVCRKVYVQKQKTADPSSHESQPEEDCLHELPEEVQSRRDESNTGTYQDLSLDTMDYTSLYSKIQDSCRQQTPTVERGGHVYAVADSSTVEPPSQYDKIQ